jgi:hypothetical protein
VVVASPVVVRHFGSIAGVEVLEFNRASSTQGRGGNCEVLRSIRPSCTVSAHTDHGIIMFASTYLPALAVRRVASLNAPSSRAIRGAMRAYSDRPEDGIKVSLPYLAEPAG